CTVGAAGGRQPPPAPPAPPQPRTTRRPPTSPPAPRRPAPGGPPPRTPPLGACHAARALPAASAGQPAHSIGIPPAVSLPSWHTPVGVVTLCLLTLPAARGRTNHPSGVTKR